MRAITTYSQYHPSLVAFFIFTECLFHIEETCFLKWSLRCILNSSLTKSMLIINVNYCTEICHATYSKNTSGPLCTSKSIKLSYYKLVLLYHKEHEDGTDNDQCSTGIIIATGYYFSTLQRKGIYQEKKIVILFQRGVNWLSDDDMKLFYLGLAIQKKHSLRLCISFWSQENPFKNGTGNTSTCRFSIWIRTLMLFEEKRSMVSHFCVVF